MSEVLCVSASQDIWGAAGLGGSTGAADQRAGSGLSSPGLLLTVGSWAGSWTSPDVSKH